MNKSVDESSSVLNANELTNFGRVLSQRLAISDYCNQFQSIAYKVKVAIPRL